jgi:hypothetical protein
MCYILSQKNTMVFFWEMHVFLQFSWIGLFGAKWAFLHLENCDWQEVFLSKTTSIPQGRNVLDAAAANIDGFLRRDKCVSSTRLNGPIWNKVSLSQPWKMQVAGRVPFKNLLCSQREAIC